MRFFLAHQMLHVQDLSIGRLDAASGDCKMKSSSLIAILLVGAAVTAAPALAKTSLSKGKQVCEAAAKAQTPAPKSVRTDDDATRSNDATITYKLKIKSAEDKTEILTCLVDRTTDTATIAPAS
jgi:hypothetical protein